MPSGDVPTFRNVLIYAHTDTVGDGLVKIPFVRELRHRFPTAHITWCAGIGPSAYAGALAPLVEGLLDEVIEKAGIGTGVWDLVRPARPLPGRRFDLVVDTQRTLVRTLGVRRISHGLFLSGAANFRFSDRRPPAGTPRPRHLIDYLGGLIDLAGAAGEPGPAPALPVPASLRAAARALLPDGPLYVGIAPGAGDRAKIWPLAGFVEVARRQVAHGRVPVFFIGPEERSWLDELRTAVPEARFPEWDEAARSAEAKGPVFAIALAELMAAAVANDSGAGHMLAAGGAPLVSLFSKHDPEKYAPRVRPLEIVDSKAFGGVDPALIPAEAVAEALERVLAASQART